MDRITTTRPSNLVYLATLSAFMGAISMGAVVGWSAPAFDDMAREDSVPQLKENDPVKSWIASCISLGALVGALIGGKRKTFFNFHLMNTIVLMLSFLIKCVLIFSEKTELTK